MLKAVILGTAHGHVIGMAKELQSIEGAQLTGVWDPDATRLAANAAALKAPAIAKLDEAVKSGATLALIGAVPNERAELACRAAEAGLHVIVDKPLAVTHDDLDRVIATQKRTGRIILAFYPYRGQPFVVAAKRAIDEGKIGQVVRVMSLGPHKLNAPNRPAWHWTRENNGGALVDIGSHHFDLACWLTGSIPKQVFALQTNFTQPQHTGFQDFSQAMVQFDSGALAHIEADWLNPTSMKNFGDTRIWVLGTTGKIEVRAGDTVSGEMWTAQAAAVPLEGVGSMQQWERQLFIDTAAGRYTAIQQDEVWRVSRLSLCALDSAQRNGAGVAVPRS
jgi:predicted dehydrogenase